MAVRTVVGYMKDQLRWGSPTLYTPSPTGPLMRVPTRPLPQCQHSSGHSVSRRMHTHERAMTLEGTDLVTLHPDSCSLQDTPSSPDDFPSLVILSAVHVSLSFRVLPDLLFSK